METTKARSEAAALVAVVFLLGALLGFVGNHLWGERVWGMRDNPPLQANRIAAELTKELQLSTAQQSQLNEIIVETQAKWQALYAPLEPQRTEIREEGHQEIRKILRADQLPKFEAFMARLDEQRKREAQKSAIPSPAH